MKDANLIERMKSSLIFVNALLDEIGADNLKAVRFYKNRWCVRFHKGKQMKFKTFDEMYDFLNNG